VVSTWRWRSTCAISESDAPLLKEQHIGQVRRECADEDVDHVVLLREERRDRDERGPQLSGDADAQGAHESTSAPTRKSRRREAKGSSRTAGRATRTPTRAAAQASDRTFRQTVDQDGEDQRADDQQSLGRSTRAQWNSLEAVGHHGARHDGREESNPHGGNERVKHGSPWNP
jgi:hypothetical protein